MNKITKSVTTAASITVVLDIDGKKKTFTVKSSDERFSVLKRYIADDSVDAIVELMDTTSKVSKLSDGKIKKGANGQLAIEDEEIPVQLADKIKAVAASDYDPTPFINFWKRLKQNPSEHSRRQFYEFIKHCDCNITADGHVIVYKGVKSDLRSNHSSTHQCRDGRKIDLVHTPGTFLEIPRGDAVDNPSVACSFGLHCAPWCHVKSIYGSYGAIVELLLDPADVVSVPHDGRGEKLRVCKYKIIRVMKQGDEPLRDVLAKMKRKTTAEGKVLREKAEKIKKTVVEFEGGNLVLSPDILIAGGVEQKDEINLFLFKGYALLGKRKDTESLEKQVQQQRGKFADSKTIQLRASARGAVSIEEALISIIGEDRKTYAKYNVEITTLSKKKIIKITPTDELTDASRKVIASKKEHVKSKAVKKVQKKAQKKKAKKAATKKAKK